MTYKLEPGLNRISSPVVLILPDGKHMKFENGKMVSQALFDRKYQDIEFKANSNDIEIVLINMDSPSISWIGEEQTFF